MKTSVSVRSTRNSRFAPAIAFLLSLSLLLSGCTTLTSVPLADHASVGPSLIVHVGDHVAVQMKTGPALAFKVTALEPDAIVGANVRVKYEDMRGLRVRRLDMARTSLTVVAVVLLVALVASAATVSFAGPGVVGG